MNKEKLEPLKEIKNVKTGKKEEGMLPKQSPKKIGYKPLGKYVLLKPSTQTDSGIQLLSNSQNDLTLPVVALGEGVTEVKIGDKVVYEGGVLMFEVDGIVYYQLHVANIVGIVDEGSTFTAVKPPPPAPGQTDHYLQK